MTPAFAEALVPEEVPEAQTGEAAYALSMRRKARASMAASANTSTKSLGIGRILPEVGGRAQGVHSTPHGVGEARLDPQIGQTSRKYLAGTSREDTAGEATVAHLNVNQRHPQQLPQYVSVQDRHRPSPKVIGGNAVAEVRGIGEVVGEIARVDVVAEIVGRESHHPEARVPKTALVHHASIMHVLSSKMTTGKCPKAEMWLLDTINDRDVLFDPYGTKCPFPTRMLSDTRRTKYGQEDHEDLCIKDNWRLHDTDKPTDSWMGKTIFRLKHKHQVAMSSQRKKSFKVSFDRKVKTRTFQVEDDMVRHQHIIQSKQNCIQQQTIVRGLS